jgi:hypothetical protein
MAVMMPREKWTDERLDDLSKKVDDGFARADKKMNEGFARADKKMNEGFARLDKKMDDGFARVDNDIRELRHEMRSLQRTMYGSTVVIVVALLGSNAF